MRKVIFTLLILGLAFVGAGTLQAQPAPPTQVKKQVIQKKMGDKLNLNDAQKKQLDEMRTTMQKNAVQLHSKIQLARIDLRELLKADEPDKGAIENKLNEIARLQTDQKMLRINHWFEVKKILTPEQMKIWKSEIRGKWFHSREMRGNHGGMMREHREIMKNYRGKMGNPLGTIEDSEDMRENPLGMVEDHEYMIEIPEGPMEDE